MEMGCMRMRRIRLPANSVFLAMASSSSSSSPATILPNASRRFLYLFSLPYVKPPHLISFASSSHRRSISVSAPSCSSAPSLLSLPDNDDIPDFGGENSCENPEKGPKMLLTGMSYPELQVSLYLFSLLVM